MTKQVRIENADTSNYKVIVQTWDSYPPMPDGTQIPDQMVKEEVLEHHEHPVSRCQRGINALSSATRRRL